MDVSLFLNPYSPQITLPIYHYRLCGQNPSFYDRVFFHYSRPMAFQLNNCNDLGFTCLIALLQEWLDLWAFYECQLKPFCLWSHCSTSLTNLICTKLELNVLHRPLLQMFQYGAEKGPRLLSLPSLTHRLCPRWRK